MILIRAPSVQSLPQGIHPHQGAMPGSLHQTMQMAAPNNGAVPTALQQQTAALQALGSPVAPSNPAHAQVSMASYASVNGSMSTPISTAAFRPQMALAAQSAYSTQQQQLSLKVMWRAVLHYHTSIGRTLAPSAGIRYRYSKMLGRTCVNWCFVDVAVTLVLWGMTVFLYDVETLRLNHKRMLGLSTSARRWNGVCRANMIKWVVRYDTILVQHYTMYYQESGLHELLESVCMMMNDYHIATRIA